TRGPSGEHLGNDVLVAQRRLTRVHGGDGCRHGNPLRPGGRAPRPHCGAATSSTPFIVGWYVHTYDVVPVPAPTVCRHELPGAIDPESKPPSRDVAVCGNMSALRQTMVSPARTCSTAGLKRVASITTVWTAGSSGAPPVAR